LVKLIMGLKGSGKTKNLIELIRIAEEIEPGDVVCIEKGEKLLNDMKNIYNDPNKQWPVKWLDRSLSESDFQKQAIQYNRDLERRRLLSERYENVLSTLQSNLEIIQNNKLECQNAKEQIKVDRAIWNAENITKEVAKQLSNIKNGLLLVYNSTNAMPNPVRGLDEDRKISEQNTVSGRDKELFERLMRK